MSIKLSIKRNGKSSPLRMPAFNGMMVCAVLATIGACIYGTMTLEGSRKLPPDYAAQDSLLAEKQQLIDDLNSVPVAAPLKKVWAHAAAAAKFAGVELQPNDAPGQESGANTYTGPMNHWSGTFSGSPADVLALAMKLQKEIPIFLFDYTVSDGQMKLNFSVVGV